MKFKEIFLVLFSVQLTIFSLELRNGAYDDLVISISESVPSNDCKSIITNLQKTITHASQYLYSALDSRAYLRTVTVILPGSWSDQCAPSTVVADIGIESDVTVLPPSPIQQKIWTEQSAGCGEQGDQIYISYLSLLQQDNDMSRIFIKEFSKYRYGVFDEEGFENDPIYPICYFDDEKKSMKLSSCSDLPIKNNGICEKIVSSNQYAYNKTLILNENARSSIMFAPEAPSVSMFCDEGTHDRFAPTKHNFLCQYKSTLDVILQHKDLNKISKYSSYNINTNQPEFLTNTTPTFTFRKQILTRYVLVIENSKHMLVRESWTFLRNAIRKWALYDLPENSEVGLVIANDTSATKLLQVSPLHDITTRDLIASNIPYLPGDSVSASCLHCALQEAVNMLKTRSKNHGMASSVVLVIAPGMNMNTRISQIITEMQQLKIRVAAVNYPIIARQQSLDDLAKDTNGVAYTVFEEKHNVIESLLSTYFRLTNILYNIVETFYQGNRANLPLEIHRRELGPDSRNSITGSFVMDNHLGKPVRFAIYTHNVELPLIKDMQLISPSNVVYSTRSDSLIGVKILTIHSNITETGTWTYSIERYPGNPQPHYVQVIATPRSFKSPIIRAKFWVKNLQNGLLILYAKVKKGQWPVLSAKVEVRVTRFNLNNTFAKNFDEKIDLLDTGSGDPDIMKNDGIYSKYFNVMNLGSGTYNFEAIVTDNGNTAYSWQEYTKQKNTNKECCGSFYDIPSVQTLPSFQRYLPPVSIVINYDQVNQIPSGPIIGRIIDLRSNINMEERKVNLIWTAPDMGGRFVARYEIKYGTSIADVVDRFDTATKIWDDEPPYPLSPGSETTFSLNFANKNLLYDRPLYFAIRAFTHLTKEARPSKVSNWVRVFVPSPPPPPPPQVQTIPTIYSSNEYSSWPYAEDNYIGVNAISSRTPNDFVLNLQAILSIIGGIFFLIFSIAMYSYFCVFKKRHESEQNKSPIGDKHTNISIVSNNAQLPNSQNNLVPTSQHLLYSNQYKMDPHSVGVPMYDEDSKQRYSLVNQQEQQLIEELKQQQLFSSRDQQFLKQLQPSNGRILSPYESWTASQLLHEHERRQSPHQPQDCLTNLPPYELTNSSDVNNGIFDQLMPQLPPLPENNFYVYSSPNHSQINANSIYGMVPKHAVSQHLYVDNVHSSGGGSSPVTSSTNSSTCNDVVKRKNNNITIV